MKIPLTLLEILVVASVFIPFFIFIYKGLTSTNSINKKAESLLKSNGLIYPLKEAWNNKFIGITEDKTTVTYISFKEEAPLLINFNRSEIIACELIADYKTDRDKVTRLKHLDLLVRFNEANKEAVTIKFYDSDEGFIEDYELQRIEKWQAIIESLITKGAALKRAS